MLATGCRVSAAVGAACPRLAPRRRDDDRDAPAVRLPATAGASAARARRRRRARELLGVATLAPGGARAVADGHRAAPASVVRRVPGSARACATGRRSTPAPRVAAIRGRHRVAAVDLKDLDDGRGGPSATRSSSPRDWIPDQVRRARRDQGGPRLRGPVVHGAAHLARTRVHRRNLIHGAEAADVAALSGRHAASAVAGYLGSARRVGRRARADPLPPGPWDGSAPNVVTASPGRPSRPRLRAARARLGGPAPGHRDSAARPRVLWTGRPRRVGPGRSTGLPDGWAGSADPAGDPVRDPTQQPSRL